jgi:hypothetical protein
VGRRISYHPAVVLSCDEKSQQIPRHGGCIPCQQDLATRWRIVAGNAASVGHKRRTIMFCPHCGDFYEDGARYCPTCQQALSGGPPVDLADKAQTFSVDPVRPYPWKQRLIRGVMLAITLSITTIITSYLFPSHDPQPSPTLPPAATPSALWVDYTNSTGRFSVCFPTKPEYTASTQPTDTVGIANRVFSSDMGDYRYAVSYSDYPERMVKACKPGAILAGSRDHFVSETKGNLISEHAFMCNGFQGSDGLIAGGEVRVRLWIILVHNRLYRVMAIYNEKNRDDPDIHRFFSSFKLL